MSPPSKFQQAGATSSVVAFPTFVQKFVQEFFSFHPTLATSVGFHDYDDQLESFSPESRQELQKFVQRSFQALRQFHPEELSAEERCDYQLLELQLLTDKFNGEELKAWQRNPALYPETILESAYLLLSRSPRPWEPRLRFLVSRLQRVPSFLQEAKINLKNPPKILVQVALEVTEGGLAFFRECQVDSLPVPVSLKKEVQQGITGSLQVLEEYRQWLQATLLPLAQGEGAIGKSLFAYMLHDLQLLPYSWEELLALAEENFRQTEKELVELAKKLDPRRSWNEILQEKAKEHPTSETLLSTYQALAEKAKVFVVNHRIAPLPPRDEFTTLETPLFARSLAPWAAYYPPPPFEEKGTGEFWVTPVSADLPPQERELQLQEHAFHQLPTKVAHETYPGHHLQASFSRTFSSPLMKQAFFLFSVPVEGWGFYTEEMMGEAGFYSNPYTQLAQKKDGLWRALRVLLDVRLHTQKMTPGQAVEALEIRLSLPKAKALAEVKRIVECPTQMLSYFAGKQEILALREECRRRWKEKFTLFRFHQKFLEQGGCLPISLIREKLFPEK